MTYSQADITVPYAVANFAEIRHKGYYYVDKTNYIPLLERYKAPVFLRPRRFGKSLLVSILAHYYDRNMATQFEELFGGTWIGEQPLLLGYDHPEGQLQNGLAKLDDQERMQKHT